MHTNSHGPTDPEELKGQKYERSDISDRVVNKIMWWFFLSTGAMIFIGWLIYVGFVSNQNRLVAQPETLAVKPFMDAPAGTPLIQGNVTTKRDIADLRHEEQQKLDNYWRDANGKVNLPVGRAMALVGQEGLPSTASPEAERETVTRNIQAPGTQVPPPRGSHPVGGQR